MARHRRHRRSRRYGSSSVVTIPGLSAIPIINDSVKVSDVAVGIAVGVFGAALLKGVLKKALYDPAKPADNMWTKFNDAAGAFVPAVMGIGVGAALYYAQKKSQRGAGHAAGAALAGVALSVKSWAAGQDFAKPKADGTQPLLDFSEVTQLNLGGYRGMGDYRGLLVRDTTDGSMNGLLVKDTTDGSLSGLAAMSMGDDDHGIESLAGM